MAHAVRDAGNAADAGGRRCARVPPRRAPPLVAGGAGSRRPSKTRWRSACSPAPAATGPRAGRRDGYYPRIAGKPDGYLFNQLLNFRDGRRHYALMSNLLAPLGDAYLREIADHFASLSLPIRRRAVGAGRRRQRRRRRLVNEGDTAAACRPAPPATARP